jgi:hypothetical protein
MGTIGTRRGVKKGGPEKVCFVEVERWEEMKGNSGSSG